MALYEPQGILEPPSRSGTRRLGGGGRIFSDDGLHWLEVLLDEAFTIPGTHIRFGIDGIVGLIPGLGDVLAGVLSLVIPLAAWFRGVPYITVIRMLTNVAIGLLVGTIPVFGDAFDIFWKANRRNYRLLTRSIADPRRRTWSDWAFLVFLGLAIGVIFALPILLLIWLVSALAHWHPGR